VSQGVVDVTGGPKRGVINSDARVDALVRARAAARPDALAVAATDATLTYAQLCGRAAALASTLRNLGVGRDVPVALCVPRSAALVVGALGVLEAGGAYVALDPTYPDDRLRHMVADSGATVVLTSAASPQIDAPGVTVVDIDSPRDGTIDPPPADAIDDLAYVIYTSGSTGLPKGVMVEHRSLLSLVDWHVGAFRIEPSDRGTQVASPGFDASVWEIWPYLAAGASVHVPDERLRSDPAALRDWLVEQRITVSFLPTALADSVIGLRWPPATALRILLTGGDVLHRRPARDLPFDVVNNYGLTETTVVATSGPVDSGEGDGAAPSIGRAIAGAELHVVDAELSPVPDGEAGELLVGGALLARGYLGQPELTAQRFVADDNGGRLYRTGDLVRRHPSGDIDFLGRIDDQVKIRGVRVELGEVAAVLSGEPTVRSCVVVATDDAPGERRLVAYVVANGDRVDAQLLDGAARRRLPEHMVPSTYVWLDELPITPNGKVDRAALPPPPPPARRVEDLAAPRNDLEEALVPIVAELLALDSVGIDENFFMLGGHSLLGAQLVMRVADRFGVELPLRSLFDNPTVEAMAAAIDALIVESLDDMTDEDALRLTADLSGGAA
jgi:amino acid adenylation domain-containing protein